MRVRFIAVDSIVDNPEGMVRHDPPVWSTGVLTSPFFTDLLMLDDLGYRELSLASRERAISSNVMVWDEFPERSGRLSFTRDFVVIIPGRYFATDAVTEHGFGPIGFLFP